MTSPTFADEARFAGEAGADAPNIVFVLIDTLRADHVSGLGYPRNTTPNIDAYAQQGVMFERAYSQSNWTPPSVASIFTSLIPEAHGAFGAREALPSDKPILTELLNANGYRTGIFADNPFVSAELGYSRGADTFYQANPLPFLRLLGIATLLQEPRIPGLMKLADFLTQEEKSYWDKEDDELVFANAYRFIDASSDRPYFAYAHIVSPACALRAARGRATTILPRMRRRERPLRTRSCERREASGPRELVRWRDPLCRPNGGCVSRASLGGSE